MRNNELRQAMTDVKEAEVTAFNNLERLKSASAEQFYATAIDVAEQAVANLSAIIVMHGDPDTPEPAGVIDASGRQVAEISTLVTPNFPMYLVYCNKCGAVYGKGLATICRHGCGRLTDHSGNAERQPASRETIFDCPASPAKSGEPF